MNIAEIKHEYETQLAASELRLHELDRMAQECFAGIKKRYDDDVAVWTELFINLSTREAYIRDWVRDKLGLNIPTPLTVDEHDPIPLKPKHKRN